MHRLMISESIPRRCKYDTAAVAQRFPSGSAKALGCSGGLVTGWEREGAARPSLSVRTASTNSMPRTLIR